MEWSHRHNIHIRSLKKNQRIYVNGTSGLRYNIGRFCKVDHSKARSWWTSSIITLNVTTEKDVKNSQKQKICFWIFFLPGFSFWCYLWKYWNDSGRPSFRFSASCLLCWWSFFYFFYLFLPLRLKKIIAIITPDNIVIGTSAIAAYS